MPIHLVPLLCSLVLAKIEEFEELGGAEAVARANWAPQGIWAGLDGVWMPDELAAKSTIASKGVASNVQSRR